MASQVLIWLEACRPKTLAISICPVLIGSKIAYTHGKFDWLLFFWTLLGSLCIQIGTNLANDYFDFVEGADISDRKGPRRVTQTGLVSKEAIKRAVMIAFGFSALCSVFLILKGGWPLALLATSSIAFGLLYKVISHFGLADIFVLLFFGPLATGTTYFLQTGKVSTLAFIVGGITGFIPVAILVIGYIRDLDEDKLLERKTIPTVFGVKAGQLEYAFTIIAALMVSIWYALSVHKPVFLYALLPLSLYVIYLIKNMFSFKDPRELNQLFGKTSLLLMAITIAFCLS